MTFISVQIQYALRGEAEFSKVYIIWFFSRKGWRNFPLSILCIWTPARAQAKRKLVASLNGSCLFRVTSVSPPSLLPRCSGCPVAVNQVEKGAHSPRKDKVNFLFWCRARDGIDVNSRILGSRYIYIIGYFDAFFVLYRQLRVYWQQTFLKFRCCLIHNCEKTNGSLCCSNLFNDSMRVPSSMLLIWAHSSSLLQSWSRQKTRDNNNRGSTYTKQTASFVYGYYYQCRAWLWYWDWYPNSEFCGLFERMIFWWL